MRILIVNKFLYPNGGSETYIFKLGEQLEKNGNMVQYFGMEDKRNIVGNAAGCYTKNMDFHTGKLARLLYPFKIIYSQEARKLIRKVLDDFNPDVVHLNNFNFQITPSIIYEINNYRKKKGRKVKIVFTAHDYQFICPNHMLYCPKTEKNCEKCIDGDYFYCVEGGCIHNSKAKSILGAFEGYLYKWLRTYRYIDVVICPSMFIKEKMDHNKELKGKTIVLYNFAAVDGLTGNNLNNRLQKEDYMIYFGRYTKEKGIEALIKVCSKMPDIRFVFAGRGSLEEKINQVENIENRGFITGEKLEALIQRAALSIYPSEWYENCPFSVMESIQYGTPVLGADIGGIPELIDEGITGELFESGNEMVLEEKIKSLWKNKNTLKKYQENCLEKKFLSVEEYCRILTDEVY